MASVFLQSVLSPVIVANTSLTTAPTPLFTSSPPRRQRYPTLAEKHPFRQRGIPLPPLSSRRKRRCRRRCPRRNHQSRTRGTPRSTTIAQNHSPPNKIIHPTRACPHCPAFFHHQSDLDDHAILCKPVASVASSETTLAAEAALSCLHNRFKLLHPWHRMFHPLTLRCLLLKQHLFPPPTLFIQQHPRGERSKQLTGIHPQTP